MVTPSLESESSPKGLVLVMVFFCILLFVMVTASAAAPLDTPQDLSGKMLVFSQGTRLNHVKLFSDKEDLAAITVCLRFFTDLQRPYYLFNLASSSLFHNFRIFTNPETNEIMVGTKEMFTGFPGQDYKINTWHSLCATWDAASGLEQMWLNGKPSVRKYISNSNIAGSLRISIGQEHDFTLSPNPELSFVGMMSDIHMWDYVISPCEIQRYTEELRFTPGNALNWGSMPIFILGRVVVENKQSLNCP
ncbi:C-reactive protein-like [Sphaeramia orbicularis]|uniref:C-reactive protein-like n=1 Tax=Sphaeramia orbicularis TaxID=375764 RepID=UPI0011806FBE|nr:C-reactive protein-like [Sphaeramia orbicularis]